MDEEHIKFISATGFDHFWRGVRQKERMSVHLPHFFDLILTFEFA